MSENNATIPPNTGENSLDEHGGARLSLGEGTELQRASDASRTQEQKLTKQTEKKAQGNAASESTSPASASPSVPVSILPTVLPLNVGHFAEATRQTRTSTTEESQSVRDASSSGNTDKIKGTDGQSEPRLKVSEDADPFSAVPDGANADPAGEGILVGPTAADPKLNQAAPTTTKGRGNSKPVLSVETENSLPAGGSEASHRSLTSASFQDELATAPPRVATGSGVSVSASNTTGTDSHSVASPPLLQMGQALASIHKLADGSSHLTIRLNPLELGTVQVRITHSLDGSASVSLAVERPDTLRSLVSDLGHLHQVLDRAGLPEQRSVSLHLAVSEPTRSHDSTSAGPQLASDGGARHQHGREERSRPPQAGSAGASSEANLPSHLAPIAASTARWIRAGINITA